jgi:NADH pyrophosphatase NudC (nudix superfamily)
MNLSEKIILSIPCVLILVIGEPTFLITRRQTSTQDGTGLAGYVPATEKIQQSCFSHFS